MLMKSIDHFVDISFALHENVGDVNRGAKVPPPPAGHKWKEVRHDNTVSTPHDADGNYAFENGSPRIAVHTFK